MGLFDKLRNVVSTTQSDNDPLADVVVKNYFEIICGMRHTFLSSGPEKVSDNEIAKKYVEYFLGCSCDEEKLQKTLELYNISRVDYPNNKTEAILSDFRKSLINSTRYCLNRHEACKMFYNNEILMAARELNEILEIIKNNVNYRHFSQGVQKMNYSSAIKDIVITNSFFEDNPVMKQIVLEYLVDTLLGRMNSEKYNMLYDAHDDVALVVIKALHFEKHGKQREGYTTITDNEYRNFVLSVPYYNRVIEDNPFDKEKYIAKFTKGIKSRQVFYGVYSSFKDCFHITSIDDYFCDAICNLLWKTISQVCDWENSDGNLISESKSMTDVFNMILTYLDNPDEYDDLEIEPFFDDEDEEIGDVEVYNIISDDVRSSLGAIDLDDE